MIEVEKKFALSPEDEKRLTDGAEFLKEKTFTDVYYDTPDYALTRKDWWLRSRDGRLELKISKNNGKIEERSVDHYEEIGNDEEIKRVLGLNDEEDLDRALKSRHIVPCGSVTTRRRKFKKGDFLIDLDETDFGYAIAEIELMVPEGNAKDAEDRIVAFALDHGLALGHVRGKILKLLEKQNPAHVQALIDAGVVAPN